MRKIYIDQLHLPDRCWVSTQPLPTPAAHKAVVDALDRTLDRQESATTQLIPPSDYALPASENSVFK